MFVAGVALYSLANVVLFFMARSAAARWVRLAADIRASGEPLTFEEIEATRQINRPFAGSALEVIFAALEKAPPTAGVMVHDHGCTGDAFEPFSAKCIEATREYVRHFDNELLLLDENGFPDSFGMNPKRSVFSMQPDLSHNELARSLGKLLAARSRLQAFDSDAAGTIRSIKDQLELAELLYSEPRLLFTLAGMAQTGVAVDSTELLLSSGERSATELSELAAFWAQADRTDTLTGALRGERAYFIESTDAIKPEKELAEFLKREGLVRDRSWTEYLDWDTLLPSSVDWWMLSTRCVAVGAYDRFVRASGDTTTLLKATREHEAALYRYWPPHTQVRITVPSFGRSVVLHGRQVGINRSTRVAIAAEQFRQHNGRWPQTVVELVPKYLPAVPLDPFDKMPIRMEHKDGWVVFYTVGEDLGDHGGQLPGLQLPTAPPNKRDYGLRLLDVERRGLRIAEPEPEKEKAGP